MDAESFVDELRSLINRARDGADVFVCRAGGEPERVENVDLDGDGDIVIHID